MNDQTAVRRFAGPSAFLQDRPGCPGEVEAIRGALVRALRTDPEQPISTLCQIAVRALDAKGYRRPTPAHVRALVERIAGQ